MTEHDNETLPAVYGLRTVIETVGSQQRHMPPCVPPWAQILQVDGFVEQLITLPLTGLPRNPDGLLPDPEIVVPEPGDQSEQGENEQGVHAIYMMVGR